MMKQNKISVIVPVFRVEKYLSKCVDSILGQTYKNLEVILVDDGSDDSCPQICDEYGQKDCRVKVIHRKNGGLSAARNTGIEAAEGDVIALVDSDDYIGKYMFEQLLNAMESNGADISMCDYKYVHENDNPSDKDEKHEDVSVMTLDGIQAQYYMYDTYRNRTTFTVAWNKLYKKKLFDGITYPEGRIYEDEARTHALLYRAERIAYVQAPYYYYLQRDDSIVGSSISTKKLQLIDAYVDRLTFYRQKSESMLWQKEVTHSMHMYCYLHKMLKQAGVNDNIKDQPQTKFFVKELKYYKKVGNINFRLAIEILLFVHFYGLYFSIWNKKKN